VLAIDVPQHLKLMDDIVAKIGFFIAFPHHRALGHASQIMVVDNDAVGITGCAELADDAGFSIAMKTENILEADIAEEASFADIQSGDIDNLLIPALLVVFSRSQVFADRAAAIVAVNFGGDIRS